MSGFISHSLHCAAAVLLAAALATAWVAPAPAQTLESRIDGKQDELEA